MRSESRRFPDAGGGTVSAVIAYPEAPSGVPTIVLAHGAGSDMHGAFLVFMQRRLAHAGYTSVRFNFPYTEQGRRIPDRAPVLEACFRSVLAELRAVGMTRLIIGGRSMGGRMATHLAAAGDAIEGLILLGYPLHAVGRPDKLRVEHLPRITVPMLFVTGTRDELCPLALLQSTLRTLPAPTTLHVVDDGTHSFAVRRRHTGRSQAEVDDEIAASVIEWLGRIA